MSTLSLIQWLVSITVPVIITELIRREINQKGPKLVYYSSDVITHRIMMPSLNHDARPQENVPPTQPCG